jgi:hypothetical protein
MWTLWTCLRTNNEHFSSQCRLWRCDVEELINWYLDCGDLYIKLTRYKCYLYIALSEDHDTGMGRFRNDIKNAVKPIMMAKNMKAML